MYLRSSHSFSKLMLFTIQKSPSVHHLKPFTGLSLFDNTSVSCPTQCAFAGISRSDTNVYLLFFPGVVPHLETYELPATGRSSVDTNDITGHVVLNAREVETKSMSERFGV